MVNSFCYVTLKIKKFHPFWFMAAILQLNWLNETIKGSYLKDFLNFCQIIKQKAKNHWFSLRIAPFYFDNNVFRGSYRSPSGCSVVGVVGKLCNQKVPVRSPTLPSFEFLRASFSWASAWANLQWTSDPPRGNLWFSPTYHYRNGR